jgi:2-keto-3-deoxy-L-rhamnonate aldolase RhmA
MVQDFATPAIVVAAAEAGLDFIIVDMEHGPASYADVQDICIAAKNTGLQVLVRATKNSYEYMAKVLDMGADGLMIPHVDTPEEVKRVVDCSRYPPVGNRSYGMRQWLSKFHTVPKSADYIKAANEHVTIFIQVETPRAAESIDALLDVPCIDGVIVGPADFTMNMGIIGQYEDPSFTGIVDGVLASCQAHGLGFGIHLKKPDLAAAWKEKGANILLYSSAFDLLKEKMAEIATNLR